MSTAHGTMTRNLFRESYSKEKPNWELIDGVPEQKTLPTWLHSILQTLIAQMLSECGYKAVGTELTLEVSETWDPVPDVTAILGLPIGHYQSTPPAVIVEILSPEDSFSVLNKKCRKYADWGIPDIIAIDPIERIVYRWQDGLIEIHGDYYSFNSIESNLNLSDIWHRLDIVLGLSK